MTFETQGLEEHEDEKKAGRTFVSFVSWCFSFENSSNRALSNRRPAKMITNCAKCGSDKIIPLVGISDQGQYSDGTLKTKPVGYTNPTAWIFKGSVTAKLHASICGACGYTELTAENPAVLYEAFQKATANLRQ